MAFSPPALMIATRIYYGIAVGIEVVGGENSIQRPVADTYIDILILDEEL